MAQKWYSIKAAADSQSAEISIFDAIGATWDGEGVTAKQFIADLQAIKAPSITLSINSPGGSLFDGIAIYNALKRCNAQITGRVMGVAASAASVVLMAADTIEMPANTFLMLHKASWGAYGNADEMQAAVDTLATIDKAIVATYAARTGKSNEDITSLLDQGDVWLSADEAVAQGFANKVTPLMEVSASYKTKDLPTRVKAAFAPDAATVTLRKNTARAIMAECGFGSSASLSADAKVLVVTDSEDGKVYTYDWVVVEGAGSWVKRHMELSDPNPDDDDDDEGGPGNRGQQPDGGQCLTSRLTKMAADAGLTAHLKVLALDPRVVSVTAARQVIAEAREVSELAAAVGKSDMTAALIAKRSSVSDARQALALALASDQTDEIDNKTGGGVTKKPSTGSTAQGPTAFWAAKKTTA